MTESLTREDILGLKNDSIPETRIDIAAKVAFELAHGSFRNCDPAVTEEILDIALPEIDTDHLVDALRVIDNGRGHDPSEAADFLPVEATSKWSAMQPVQRLADTDEIAAMVVADDRPDCHIDKFRGNWSLAEQTAATLTRIDRETMVSLDLDARIALDMDEQEGDAERTEVTTRSEDLAKNFEDESSMGNAPTSDIGHGAIDVDLADIPRGVANSHQTIRSKHD